MLRKPFRSAFAALLWTVVLCSPAVSSPPVGRQTEDRFGDLFDELISRQRFDDAEQLCRYLLGESEPQSDQHAKWTIQQSRLLTAIHLTQTDFDQTKVAAAQKPCTDLLAAYPGHRRRLFLEAQLAQVAADAARHDVIETAVVPATSERIDAVTVRLSRAGSRLQQLVDQVRDERARLSSQRGTESAALVKDLVRLEQSLRVEIVSLALMQTELFAPGSQDRIAAATQAEAVAQQAATTLPADSPARREVRRIEIEAIMRAEQYGRARSELSEFVRTLDKPLPVEVNAMQVQLDIATGKLDEAASRLNSYYGSAPQQAPRSLAMDLARLEFLLASDAQAAGAGDWLDAMEQREGRYARRRGEALSLARLRAGGKQQPVDAALVAAQAEDWLRRGDPSRAAGLFAAAANAEQDSARALKQATQAAAAFLQVDEHRRASEILAKVAAAHPRAAEAAAAHLQAAIVYASSKQADIATRIEAMLSEHLELWPQGKHTAAVRQWLIKILESTGRAVAAAEVATRLSLDEINDENLDTAFRLWRTAFQSSPADELSPLMARFRQAYAPLLGSSPGRTAFRSAAACLLDRNRLSDLPARAAGELSETAEACEGLLEFRRSGSGSLPVPPASLAEIFRWRLMRDGRQYPQLRVPIARGIDGWPAAIVSSGDDAELDLAERLVWLDRTPEAVRKLREVARRSDSPGETLRAAAELLSASDNDQARQAAIEIWDELAAGMPQGSRQWHRAKLASMRLLQQLGRQSEAARRAGYVLLTTPPSEEDLKAEYHSIAE